MEVRAELTATVWKVVVEKGATVAEGDELVILESMKMEIPVAAPAAGTVTELCVAEEDRISEGDLVAVIDPSCETLLAPFKGPMAASFVVSSRESRNI